MSHLGRCDHELPLLVSLQQPLNPSSGNSALHSQGNGRSAALSLHSSRPDVAVHVLKHLARKGFQDLTSAGDAQSQVFHLGDKTRFQRKKNPHEHLIQCLQHLACLDLPRHICFLQAERILMPIPPMNRECRQLWILLQHQRISSIIPSHHLHPSKAQGAGHLCCEWRTPGAVWP